MVQDLFLWQVVVSASILWDFFLLLRDGSGMTISGFVNATSANFNATSDLSVRFVSRKYAPFLFHLGKSSGLIVYFGRIFTATFFGWLSAHSISSGLLLQCPECAGVPKEVAIDCIYAGVARRALSDNSTMFSERFSSCFESLFE